METETRCFRGGNGSYWNRILDSAYTDSHMDGIGWETRRRPQVVGGDASYGGV